MDFLIHFWSNVTLGFGVAVTPFHLLLCFIGVFLGTLIGLGAGWSRQRLGRLLDTLISAALAVPVFMIALGTIAMLGAVGGNLLTLAYLGEIPVLGVPGCIRSPKPTQIDQILASLLAGERLQRIDITMLGHGGLWERAKHGT